MTYFFNYLFLFIYQFLVLQFFEFIALLIFKFPYYHNNFSELFVFCLSKFIDCYFFIFLFTIFLSPAFFYLYLNYDPHHKNSFIVFLYFFLILFFSLLFLFFIVYFNDLIIFFFTILSNLFFLIFSKIFFNDLIIFFFTILWNLFCLIFSKLYYLFHFIFLKLFNIISFYCLEFYKIIGISSSAVACVVCNPDGLEEISSSLKNIFNGPDLAFDFNASISVDSSSNFVNKISTDISAPSSMDNVSTDIVNNIFPMDSSEINLDPSSSDSVSQNSVSYVPIDVQPNLAHYDNLSDSDAENLKKLEAVIGDKKNFDDADSTFAYPYWDYDTSVGNHDEHTGYGYDVEGVGEITLSGGSEINRFRSDHGEINSVEKYVSPIIDVSLFKATDFFYAEQFEKHINENSRSENPSYLVQFLKYIKKHVSTEFSLNDYKSIFPEKTVTKDSQYDEALIKFKYECYKSFLSSGSLPHIWKCTSSNIYASTKYIKNPLCTDPRRLYATFSVNNLKTLNNKPSRTFFYYEITKNLNKCECNSCHFDYTYYKSDFAPIDTIIVEELAFRNLWSLAQKKYNPFDLENFRYLTVDEINKKNLEEKAKLDKQERRMDRKLRNLDDGFF